MEVAHVQQPTFEQFQDDSTTSDTTNTPANVHHSTTTSDEPPASTVGVAVSPSEALPSGWEAVTDPSTGKTYYYNAATRETRWELPTAPAAAPTAVPPPAYEQQPMSLSESFSKDEPAAPPTQAAGDTSAPLADGWSETTDPATGAVYYYNATTQESSWVRPTVGNRI